MKRIFAIIIFLLLLATNGLALDYAPSSSCTDQSTTVSGCTQALLNAIGATKNATLVYKHSTSGTSTTYTFSGNVTIPSNVTVKVEEGAVLSVAVSKTLQSNGRFYGASGCITGSGPVIFGPNQQEIEADYWVIDGTGDQVEINKAIASLAQSLDVNPGIVRLRNKTYTVSAPITMARGVILRGSGIGYQSAGNYYGTVIKLANSTNDNVVENETYAENWAIEDIWIDANRANQTGASSGVVISQAYGFRLKNVRVVNAYTSGVSISNGNSFVLDGVWVDDAINDVGIYLSSCFGFLLQNCVSQEIVAGTCLDYSIEVYNSGPGSIIGLYSEQQYGGLKLSGTTRGVDVKGSYFANAGATGKCVYIADTASYNDVTGNYYYNSSAAKWITLDATTVGNRYGNSYLVINTDEPADSSTGNFNVDKIKILYKGLYNSVAGSTNKNIYRWEQGFSNLLLNGGFHIWPSGGNPVGWTKQSNVTAVQSADTYLSGTSASAFSLQFQTSSTAANKRVYQVVAGVGERFATRTFTVVFAYKCSSGVQLYNEILDQAGNALATGGTPANYTSETWEIVTRRVTLNTDDTGIWVGFYPNATGKDIYVTLVGVYPGYISPDWMPSQREVLGHPTDGLPVQIVNQPDDDKAFQAFYGTSAASAAKSITTWTTGGSLSGFLRININGTDYWMPYYTAPTS
jgi:hypothetical protein